jgi:hypothetical protein
MPYEVSHDVYFEQYTANVPVSSDEGVPADDPEQEIQLCSRYIDVNEARLIRYYLNEVALAYDDDKWVDWWIDRADYYNSDKDTDMKYITYFGSMVELDYLLKTVDTEEISKNMKEHNEFRKKKKI